MEGKDYRWGYSAKGKFIGMKLTLVLEHPSLKFLLFLLHPANMHEAKIFDQVVDELRRRRIVRRRDVVITDKGFYARRNYLVRLTYRVVPLIFSRKNFKQVGWIAELSSECFQLQELEGGDEAV